MGRKVCRHLERQDAKGEKWWTLVDFHSLKVFMEELKDNSGITEPGPHFIILGVNDDDW